MKSSDEKMTLYAWNSNPSNEGKRVSRVMLKNEVVLVVLIVTELYPILLTFFFLNRGYDSSE